MPNDDITNDAIWSRPISLYSGFADNSPTVLSFDDDDLPRMLTEHGEPGCDSAACPGRDCPAKRSHPCWSPAEFADGARRANSGVVAVNYAVFDLDHLQIGEIEGVQDRLSGVEYVIHSTHSHDPRV